LNSWKEDFSPKQIKSAITLTNNIIKKSTNSLILELDENIPLIKVNYHQIEQVIINLLQNACESLTDKEKSIIIKTKYIKSSEEISITIEDQGMGMDENTLKQITNPFFTTKLGIGGTGLGLSVSLNIINNHGGTLSFKSKPKKGTKASILLSTK